MKDAAPQMILLSDYEAPDWRVEAVDLSFDLDPEATRVTSRLRVRRVAGSPGVPLRLHGRELERLRLEVDGAAPAADAVTEDAEGLLLQGLPDSAEIVIETRLRPAANTALEGLYVSGGSLCTQCEPEGFRRITYFPDRPDVLTRYRVRLEADAGRYPVLLANGNRMEAGELPEGRHYAVWDDPFPKPSYLFALVAGDLACESDRFVTRSGREVALEVYVEYHNRERCAHALASLARAMRYDEEAFGREYDLDVYMIVAVDDFNMGAMENKGLNLFNAKYVLASPDTATDSDYVHIESVIAHEYFHNWSGNRVTCRDWFQLSLKEGLTVFRDQEFTTDNTLFGVKRIDDVQRLRAFQFPEDAGPLAHPVRPDRYAEINNFYTMTVYEKGAELIRMLGTLIGRDAFRQGLDAYFERFDGQAVTTDDFVEVMAEVSGRDLGLFRRWYTQAGTPRVTARTGFDAAARTLRIDLQQRTPPTVGQQDKAPLHIPLRIALLGRDGRRMSGRLGAASAADEWVLEVTAASQSFQLSDLAEAPAAISWLRAFSAPVLLDAGQGTAELAHLVAFDDDAFARWDAAQSLLRRAVTARVAGQADTALEAILTDAMATLLDDAGVEPVLLAALLELPAHRELLEWFEQVDPIAVHAARTQTERAVFGPIAEALQRCQPEVASTDNGEFTAAAMGRRRLLNQILAMRVALEAEGAAAAAARQYHQARSQTLRMGALAALNDAEHPLREELMEDFERRYRDDPLVLDKWFALQAGSQIPGGFERLDRLLHHPGFRWPNPNRVRAVLGPFMAANHRHFHQEDGEGYRRVGAFIERLDGLNPQTAARLVQPLTRWRRLDPQRGERMREELERLAGLEGLSRDLNDMVQRALAPEPESHSAG
ncbi:aminopeptidase N [Thioalkalivibrio sp.]|uniref:aminopeptidase N n=1 Tax=Thioalkalivibrio sp. TaxID=2093813 RepID=UPI0039754A51